MSRATVAASRPSSWRRSITTRATFIPTTPYTGCCFWMGERSSFAPILGAFSGQRIQPHLAGVLEEVDPLRRLLAVGRARDLSVRAWTINLHNFTLGERYPDAAVENAFGDRLLTDLCPANPDARAYVRTATAELSRAGMDAIVAESICYMPFDHGFHHERTPYPLSETTRFFLSLCFCPHCQARARKAGVAPDHLREEVRVELDRALRGDASRFDDVPFQRTAVAAFADGEMEAMLDAREETVTSLVGEITEAVEAAGPARFVFMDSMGAERIGRAVRTVGGRPLLAIRHRPASADPQLPWPLGHGLLPRQPALPGGPRSLPRAPARDDPDLTRRARHAARLLWTG